MDKPKDKKLGVAYIRESTEEQDKGFSPQNQERTIREYAAHNNIEITAVYKDLISGTSATKRDEFQKMIEAAMEKKFGVILVFHTSRFARNVSESRQYKDLLRKTLSIDVVSITQPFGDFDSPSSFLNEGVNELFDEYYSRQLGFWVKSACLEKRRQGKPNGNPPLGYSKKQVGYDEEKSRPIYNQQWNIHPEESELVKRIFTMYATGNYSMAKIGHILTTEGHKTKYNNPFTYSSLKGLLSSRAYLGLVTSPRKNLPDIPSTNHTPIISQELFDTCQDMIRERTKKFGRPLAQHRFYLLQGLLYCQHCLEKTQKELQKEKSVRPMLPTIQCYTDTFKTKRSGLQERYSYFCKMSRENKTCLQKKVECSVIDKQVINFMRGFCLPEDIIQMTLERLRSMFAQTRKERKPDAQLAKLLEKRKRLTFAYTEAGELTENQYLLELQEIKAEMSRLERQNIVQNMTASQEEAFIAKTEQFLKEFPHFLETELSKEEMRHWICLTIGRIWIKNGTVVSIEPRDDFKPLFREHQKVIGQTPLVTPAKSSISCRTKKQPDNGCFFCFHTEIISLQHENDFFFKKYWRLSGENFSRAYRSIVRGISVAYCSRNRISINSSRFPISRSIQPVAL